MSADRFEITDTNGLRIDGIPWRERGLLVQYAAIRQQAREVWQLGEDCFNADNELRRLADGNGESGDA